MAKAFATYEQQIEKPGKDGLLVEDAAYAEEQLRDIGYCALVNGERLLTYRAHSVIPDTTLHRKLDIGKKGNQYAQGKNDLFAVVIALRHLLPKDRFLAFK